MPLFGHQNIIGASAGGGAVFDTTLIGNSVFFDGSSDQLEMAKTSGGSASSKFTVSCWVQRNAFTEGTFTGIFNHYYSSNTGVQLTWLNADTLTWVVFSSVSGSGGQITSSGLFRDIGWYHILANYDGTNGRMDLFVNGDSVGVKSFTAGSTNPIGSGTGGAAYYWGAAKNTAGTFGRTNSYLAQCALELGTAAAPSDYVDTFTFGTNGSQVIPKATSDLVARINSAGGHSHLLDFADSSNLGNDISSNNNDFTATSMSSANQTNHTPSKVFATWNRIQGKFPQTSGSLQVPTLTEGNLRAAIASSNRGAAVSSLLMPAGSGKFAAKFTINTITGINPTIGVFDMDTYAIKGGNAFTGSSDSVALRMDGERYLDGSSASYGSAVSAGNTVEVELDMDNNTVEFLINGSAQGTISKTFTGNVGFMVDCGTNSGATDVTAEFDYTPDDTSFKTLNTANLTAPTYQGIDYFDATIYEGNGAGQRVGDFVPFTDAYTVTNSAMFRHDDVRNLSRTIEAPSSTGGKKGTWSAWYKTANIDTDNVIFDNGTTATNRFSLNMDASGQLIFSHKAVTILKTSADFKGDGAWHNVVLKVDTSLATAADRAVMFVDGVEITSFEEDRRDNSDFTQNDEIGFMDEGATQFIGSYNNSSANQWDGYLAELVFLDNQFLDASSFGQTDTSTNRWVAKDPGSLTFGNSGFYLEFKIAPGTGNGAGTDTSGNSNHFTSNGSWATHDQFVDAPSKNYATLSQITGLTPTGTAGGDPTMSDGNLRMNITGTSNGNSSSRTPTEAFAIQEGKWYFEVEAVTIGQAWNIIGLTDVDDYQQQTLSGSGFLDDAEPGQWGYAINAASTSPDAIIQDGTFLYGSDSPYNGISNHKVDTGDVLGVHIERTRNTYKMWFSRNGTHYVRNTTQQPIIEFGTRGRVIPFARTSNGTGNRELHFNFGQQLVFDGGATSFNADSDGYWKHAPVTGFKALNQDNLDDTASKLTAWAWIKNRDADDDHILVDRVRGIGKVLHSNEDDLETTEPNTVQRFLQRGVQVGSDVQVNTDRESYVLWQWLVGGSATTGSTTSPAGTIASTTIAADAGNFSVGTYTGQTSAGTVGHGLGGAPEMIVVFDKDYDNTIAVYHKFIASDAETDYLLFNNNNAVVDAATFWNDTAPNSTVFSVGTGNNTNGNGRPKLFLAFRSIPGVCKVGSYVGNGDNDGFFVNTGFKPRWVMVKSTSASRNWNVLDTARNPNNVASPFVLLPNDDATDTAGQVGSFDILSNGFKPRDTASNSNASGEVYVYLAMAEIGGNGTLPPLYGG